MNKWTVIRGRFKSIYMFGLSLSRCSVAGMMFIQRVNQHEPFSSSAILALRPQAGLESLFTNKKSLLGIAQYNIEEQ